MAIFQYNPFTRKLDIVGSGGGGGSIPLTTKGDILAYSTTPDRFPVGADGQTIFADSTQVTGLRWGTPVGGSGATESGTSIRVGSGSTMNSTKNTIYGINSTGGGINATVYGTFSHAGQGGITIGNDNFASGATVNNCIVLTSGATNVKIANQLAVVLCPNTFSSANGYGGIYIGNGINVTSTLPANTTNNNGVYIGRSIIHTAGTYAGAVIAGYNINGRDAIYPVLLGHSIVTANGLQNSVVAGYQAQAVDGQSNVVVVGTGAKAFLDVTFGVTGGGNVAVGVNAFSGAWRSTAVGGHSQALAVSSTALSYGSYTNQPHSQVWGRGGYNDVAATLIYGGSTPPNLITIYVGAVASAWANPAMPGTENVDISAALNAGTVISRIVGASGRDAKPVPTLTNVKGGHLRASGGYSTGIEIGGKFQIATTPASGVSSNTVNAEVVAAEFDATAFSAGTIETRFILLDLATGTLKRIGFAPAGSIPVGKKALVVDA